MSDLVDDAASQCFERIFLLLGERTQPAPHPLHLACAHAFQLRLQTDDHGNHFAAAHIRFQPVHLFHHDLVGLGCFVQPAAQIVVNHLLQIVDVVKEHIVKIVDRGFDIARDSNIDQKHRTVLARIDDLPHLIFCQNIAGRAAGGDDDVDLGKRGVEIPVVDDPAANQLGDLLGAGPGTVRHQNLRDTGAIEVAGGQFRHLARADQHHLLV